MSEPTTPYVTTTLAEEQAALTAVRQRMYALFPDASPDAAEERIWETLTLAWESLMECRRMLGDRLRQEAGG